MVPSVMLDGGLMRLPVEASPDESSLMSGGQVLHRIQRSDEDGRPTVYGLSNGDGTLSQRKVATTGEAPEAPRKSLNVDNRRPRSGLVLVETKILKRWKMRWVVLDESAICVYETEEVCRL